MKGKQLLILIVFVALLGGVWYLIAEKDSASPATRTGGKVLEFPINEVSRIAVKESGSELNLVKKANIWTVQERGDYPANFERVGGLLRNLWELKTVQEVKAGPSQFARLELVLPGAGDGAGTLVELKDADDKALGAILLGKKHLRKSEGGPMDFGGGPAGRYVRLVEGEKVSLVSESFDDAVTAPDQWLDKAFIKIDGPKSIAVAGVTEARRWTISRETATGEWVLADSKPDEKVDPSKASPLGSLLASATFFDIIVGDAKDEKNGVANPTSATIETFDGFRYELKIGDAQGDNHPMTVRISVTLPEARTPGEGEKPEDKAKLDEEFLVKRKRLEEKLASEKKFEGRTYLVPKYALDPLLKDRTALLPDKPAEPAASPPPAAQP